MLSFEQCFILFYSFPLLLAFDVGGLGFELCMFVAGWRYALRSEWLYLRVTVLCSQINQMKALEKTELKKACKNKLIMSQYS